MDLYVSEWFKALLEVHPLPWFAESEGGDPSVGIPDTPPSIFDNEGDLVFEIPAEQPSAEVIEEWDAMDSGCDDDYMYMSPRDGAIEQWYGQEECRRMQRAKEIAEMFNKMADAEVM